MFRKTIALAIIAGILGSGYTVLAESNYADKKASDNGSTIVSEREDSEYGDSIFEKTDNIESIDEKEIDRTNIQVYVRGYDDENGNYVSTYQKVEFPDINPMVVRERTLLPIRGVAEKLGYEVKWNNIDRRVDIVKESKNFGDKLPAQGDRVFKALKDNSLDGTNKNENMSTTYYYFSLKNMNKEALQTFKDRILKNQSLQYGAYLRIGDSKGVAYVANSNRFGIDEARVNYTMDVPPCLYKDRTLLPLRAVGEMLGFKVEWDGNSGTVYLDGNSN